MLFIFFLCYIFMLRYYSFLFLLLFYLRWFILHSFVLFFFKQNPPYELRISDWSADVCSSDLIPIPQARLQPTAPASTASPCRPGSTGRSRGIAPCPRRAPRRTGARPRRGGRRRPSSWPRA